jgi:hypothetical protein
MTPPEATRVAESPAAVAPNPETPITEAAAMLDRLTATVAMGPSPIAVKFKPVAKQE